MTSHRPNLLLGASTVMVLILPWLVPTLEQFHRFQSRTAYWILLLQFGLFAVSLAQLAKRAPNAPGDGSTRSLIPLAGILALSLMLLAQRAIGFGSIEEVRGAAASLSMHIDQVASVATKGIQSGVTFQVTGRIHGDFPMPQPFLVALLHSLTGYRPENPMILNSFLLVALLWLAWDFGQRVGGKWTGALLLALLASVPLVARSATGSGPGLLAIVLTLVLMRLGLQTLETGGRDSRLAFLFCGALLTQALEHCPGTLLAMVLVACLAWRRDPQPIRWGAALLPLLFLPSLLRVRAIGFSPFDLGQLPGNAILMFEGLLDVSRTGTQSVVVTILGLVAIPFFALRVNRSLSKLAAPPPVDIIVAIFLLGLIIDVLIALGSGTLLVNGRLAPPFGLRLALGLVVATASAASSLNPGGWTRRGIAYGVGAGFFMFSLPALSRRAYELTIHEAPELAWKRAFISGHRLAGSLVLDQDPVIWTVHRVTALSIREVAERPAAIMEFIESRRFDSIFICQRIRVDPRTGMRVLPPDESVAGQHLLETVSEVRITPLLYLRMSRILPPGGGRFEPTEPVRDPLEGIHPSQREAEMDGFLRRYLRRLP